MKKISHSLLAVGTACSLALLPACGASSTSTDAGSGKKLKVVTAFYPFQYVAQQVGGDRVDATSLTPPGQEPHEIALPPRDVGSLASADLVIYQKGFQDAVDRAVTEQAPRNVIDVASVVTMLPASGVDEDGHTATGKDPHQWLDPTNMAALTKAVAEKLKAADPGDAALFEENAKKLDEKLATLDRSFSTGLEDCTRKDFITSHAAFAYLAKRYGLTQVGISGLSPDEQPSPARIVEVQKLAKAKGVTTIFSETLVSPAQAKAIAGDLGLKTDVLDPLEGITKDSRGSDYIAVQQSNLAALRTANGCQ